MIKSRLTPTLCLGLGLTISAALGIPAVAHAVGDPTGTYTSLNPARILDTRVGYDAPKGPVPSHAAITVQLLGRGGVPETGVSAVVANLTAVAPISGGYLSAYPTGSPRPPVSSINLIRGQTRANAVTLGVGIGGKITIYNGAGAVNVLLDVTGYYQSKDSDHQGADLFPTASPFRALDTRTQGGAIGPDSIVYLDFHFGSSASQVIAIAANLTAVSPSRGGYLTAWDGSSDRPVVSNLNFAAGQLVANAATIPASDCGPGCVDPQDKTIAVANRSSGSTQLLVDILGYYARDDRRGLTYQPITPTRIVDTRTGTGGGHRFSPNSTQLFQPDFGAAAPNTYAMQANVAAVHPSRSTYFTAYDSDKRPPTSILNAPTGQTVANAALITTRDPNFVYFNLYNSAGNTDAIIDISGQFNDPTSPSSSDRAAHQTRQTKLFELAKLNKRFKIVNTTTRRISSR